MVKWASIERQQYSAIWVWKLKIDLIMVVHTQSSGHLYIQKVLQHALYLRLKMSINRVSAIIRIVGKVTVKWFIRCEACSSPFTESVSRWRDRFSRRVPPSVNGLVHLLSEHHLPEWTCSFAECSHCVNALRVYMCTDVCTLSWSCPVEFNERN